MKNGKHILILFSLVVVILIYFGVHFIPSYKKTVYVNESIKTLCENKDYMDSSIEIRKNEAQKLLRKLWLRGYIRYYKYQKDNCLFSFTFCDGTLGGIMLLDNDSLFN